MSTRMLILMSLIGGMIGAAVFAAGMWVGSH
jgi:hypothetical protein